MPKGPDDETKMRTEEIEPSALRPRSHAAAADASGPAFAEIPAAKQPAAMRKRGGGGLLILLLLAAIAAIASAVWYFFLR